MGWSAALLASALVLAVATATAASEHGPAKFAQRVFEVRENDGVARIHVTRTAPLGVPTLVLFETVEGTAVDGFDFRGLKTELRYGADDVDVEVPVTLFDNYWNDGARAALLVLRDAATSALLDSATLHIDDDEAQVESAYTPADAPADPAGGPAYLRLFQRASAVLPTLTTTVTSTTAFVTTTTTVVPTTPVCAVGCDRECRERPWVEDDCGVCGPPENANDSPYRDCNGTCFGSAVIDECGTCVDGTSGDVPGGRDACLVCGGDNSTCAGCDGVPNSGAAYDLCGVCGGNSTSCITFIRIVPDSGPNVQGYNVHVIGSGFVRPDGEPRELACIVQDMDGDSVPAAVLSATEGSCDLNTFASLGIKDFFLSVDGTVLGPLPYLVYNGSLADAPFKVYIDTAGQQIVAPVTDFIDVPTFNAVANGSNTGALACRYRLRTEDVTRIVSGAVYNATTIVCEVPETAVSQIADLAVSFTGDSGPFVGDAEAHYYQYAPIALVARLDDSGITVRVTFNASLAIDQVAVTTLPNSATTCTAVLDPATLAKLGSEHECLFPAGDLLVITLGAGATLVPGDLIIFRNDTLRELGRQFCDPLVTPIPLQAPENPTTPVAVIVVAQTVAQCSELTVSGELSTGAGGHALFYNWTITPAPTSAEALAVIATLAAGNVSSFTFPAYSLDLGTYVITLQVTNYLGVVSPVATATVEVVDGGVPTVYIAAASPLRVVSSEETELSPVVSLAPCGPPNATLSFFWTATPDVPALAGQETKPSILLPRNSLTPRTQYNFTVTVTVVEDPSLSGTFVIVVDVLPPPLYLRILGGDWRSIGETAPLVIEVSLRDPSGLGQRVVDLELTCENAAANPAGSTCLYVDHNVSSLSTGVVAFEGIVLRNVTLGATTAPQITQLASFAAGTLIADPVHMLYRFVVRATEQHAGSVVLTDEVIIEVRIGDLPYALLDAHNVDLDDFVITRPLALSAIVALPNGTATGNLTYRWTSLAGTARAFTFEEYPLSTVDLDNPNILNGPSGPNGLLLRPEVLLPGAVYQFRLEIFAPGASPNATGQQLAYCTVQVITSTIPSGGVLLVAAASGRAVFDDFVISLPGWTAIESQLPLTYSVRLYYSEVGFVEASPQRPALLNTTMPNPKHGNVIRVIARVIQRNGAVRAVEKVVIVEPCTVTDSDSLSVLTNEFERRSSQLFLLGRWRDLQILTTNFVGCLPVSDNGRLNGTDAGLAQQGALYGRAEPGDALVAQVNAFLAELENAAGRAHAQIPTTLADILRKVCVVQTLSEAAVALPEEKSAALLERLLQAVVALNGTLAWGDYVSEDFMGCLIRAEENLLMARRQTTLADLRLFWDALDAGSALYQAGQACHQSPSTLSGQLIEYTTARDTMTRGHALSAFRFPDSFALEDERGEARCLCASSLTIASVVYGDVPTPQNITLGSVGNDTTLSTGGSMADKARALARRLFGGRSGEPDDHLYDFDSSDAAAAASIGNTTVWRPSRGSVHTLALRDCSRSRALGVGDTNSAAQIHDLGGFLLEVNFAFRASDNVEPERVVCAYLDYEGGAWSQSGVSLLRADRFSAVCLTTHLSDFVVLQNFVVPPLPIASSAPLPAIFPPWLIVLIVLGSLLILGTIALALFLLQRQKAAAAAAAAEGLNYTEFAAEHAGIAGVAPPAFAAAAAALPDDKYARRVRPPPYILPPDYALHMLGPEAVAAAKLLAVRRAFGAGAALVDSDDNDSTDSEWTDSSDEEDDDDDSPPSSDYEEDDSSDDEDDDEDDDAPPRASSASGRR